MSTSFHCGDLFAFVPPQPGSSRSPCPALNALANHGYISRDGTNIPFRTLLISVQRVYNLSFALALVLTTVGYLTCGTFTIYPSNPQASLHRSAILSFLTSFLCLPRPSWTLDLKLLCTPGPLKIAHDASLVHSDTPGSTADPARVAQLLLLAHHARSPPESNNRRIAADNLLAHHARSPPESNNRRIAADNVSKDQDGVTLDDLGKLHAAREAALSPAHKLNKLHEQVALGECGLAWCVMRTHDDGNEDSGVIRTQVLEQWFGEERLPNGWWDAGGGRPLNAIGLGEAMQRAAKVGLFMAQRKFA